LVMEFFGWRDFKNRREVGGLAGFTPTPYQSGDSNREQGITKSGNRHVRWMTTELAWSWLRFQPESALSVWFRERFGGGGKRLRRISRVISSGNQAHESYRNLMARITDQFSASIQRLSSLFLSRRPAV
jgi:transposase